VAYQKVGSAERAITLLEESLAGLRANFPADYPLVLSVQSNLAAAHQYAGRPDRAIPIFEQALAAQSDTLGPDHPSTLRTRVGLASSLLGVKQVERATALLEQALPLLQARLGKDHSTTVIAMSHLGQAYKLAGKHHLAVPMMEQVLDGWLARSGPDHPDTHTAMANLAGGYYEAGRLDKAIPLYEASLTGRVKALSWDHPATHNVAGNLGFMYEQAGRFADAARVYSDRLIATRRRVPAGDQNLLGPLAYLGNAQLLAGQHAEAEATLREAVAIGEQLAPTQWGTYRLKSLLGAALLGQGKTAEAKPLVTDGYNGMAGHAKRMPAPMRRDRLIEVLAPLVRYHDAAGNKDEAAKWRAELEALTPAVAPPPREAKQP
jgi:tetratricopeptide (TPR) repeat protein